MTNNLIIGILAAGKGTRMNSNIPKVLHTINGMTLIERVIQTAEKLKPTKIIIIVGFKKELIQKELKNYKVEYAIQKNQRGTGHAVKQCASKIINFSGNILILSGDVPLITKETLEILVDAHIKNKSVASLISAKVNNPKGYGRIKRDNNNHFLSIVEDKDATKKEQKINEINSGIYIFDTQSLFSNLLLIGNDNSQNEYYLGDVFKFIDNKKISIIKINNYYEIAGINNKDQLKKLND